MIKKYIYFLFFVCFTLVVKAQQDSILIEAKLTDNGHFLKISQTIKYKNHLSKPISKIKLLNWVAAYKNIGTPLAKRKIEDRKKELHFAKKNELGQLKHLIINGKEINNLDSENIFYPLDSPLFPNEDMKLSLQYELKLPKIEITQYGTSKDKIALKYFFIVPDSFETENQENKYYKDIEENQSGGRFWNIQLLVPNGNYTESNLPKNGNHFVGFLKNDPEFLISKNPITKISIKVKNINTEVFLGYPISTEEQANLEFLLPLQLTFISEKIGYIPEKIFISEKFKNKEDFFGNNDIKFWKFNFQMFTDLQKTDMDYFSIISKKILQQAATTYKTNDHWFENGIKTYLEISYLNKFYKDEKLLGTLPENLKIFGISPLKAFNISKIKILERYGLAYQYIKSHNLDQKIGEPFPNLSNFNDMAISQFEMGSLFNYISQKIGTEKFDSLLKNYISKNHNKTINTKDFLHQLNSISEGASHFLEPYISKHQRLNFDLKKFTKTSDGYLLKISKNTDFSIPVKISTENTNGKRNSYWFDTEQGQRISEFLIPETDIHKIQMNDGYIFPEENYRDNYLYTKGFFANMKKAKLKLLKDLPNPEYNEIYINPKASFNAYDKVLLGLNFQNFSLFEQNFQYSLTPYFSTGTQKFTGSGAVSYSYRPVEAFFQSLQFGASAAHFHYNYDLAYQKFSLATALNFAKNMRSEVSRSIVLSYNYFKKDLTSEMVQNNEYDHYDLFNIRYGYSDRKLIHEVSFATNFQLMKDFQKLSSEMFYRWEYADNKKISFRLFGGYFLSNQARNSLFNFGISKVSNYAFSYSLLGQSATSGILSQQYLLAEGGFKSFFNKTVNQWITSSNIDVHIWKMFNIYADVGVYKNRLTPPKFIWDSGVKLKIVPEFLEVYFPVQSSLGFEPTMKDYGKRIRFTLLFDLGALTGHLRRGWY